MDRVLLFSVAINFFQIQVSASHQCFQNTFARIYVVRYVDRSCNVTTIEELTLLSLETGFGYHHVLDNVNIFNRVVFRLGGTQVLIVDPHNWDENDDFVFFFFVQCTTVMPTFPLIQFQAKLGRHLMSSM